MIVILQSSNIYLAIDQINYTTSRWHNSIDEALADMCNVMSKEFCTQTLKAYQASFPNYKVYYLDETPQPYEFW